jgi:hypothetical protein
MATIVKSSQHIPFSPSPPYCDREVKISDKIGKRILPSCSFFRMSHQPLPIRSSYVARTDAKSGSESGWVEEKARSRTYKSTALSSANADWYASPKSINTLGVD